MNSKSSVRKKILVFSDWFEPGYIGGGPIRSALHFVQQMKERYNIAVLTRDRDLDAKDAYTGIACNEWMNLDEGVAIYYSSPGKLNWKNILHQIRITKPDFIYLNSMYSRYFSVYPLLFRRLGLIRPKMILAPRGMLKASAVQFKSSKKKFFLSLIRLMGIHNQLQFHATDTTECNDIIRYFGKAAIVATIPNFAGPITNYPGSIPKNEQELKIIFVGRLHPVKNLGYLLQIISSVTGSILITVVGSEEDKNYAAYCKNLAGNLNARVKVMFTGEIANKQLPEILRQHHVFALPTKGENFGHAIFEALSAGKPVLISDQTPWRDLTKAKAGWDIELGNQEEFLQALQQAADFNQQQYDEWSYAAWQHAAQFASQPNVKQLYYNLFR